MSVTNKLVGKGGKATYGGTDFQVNKWSAKVMNDTEDYTHSGSGGWKERKHTLKEIQGSFDADFDSVLNDVSADDLPTPVGSETAAELALYVSDSLRLVGSALIKVMNIDMDVKGKISYSCDFESTGEWVYEVVA